jgi:hypothetical protein
MTSLNALKNLIYKLKKEEIRSLVNFLNHNQKEKKNEKLKSIQLLELILLNKNLTSIELQNELYKKENNQAFNKLVNRLKDKIYEILLFDSNLDIAISTKRNRTIFNIRKKLIQCEIMFSRGINDELESLQDKIILVSKKFEIYDGLIEALQSKQRYVGFRSGFKANQKIKFEIDFYEKNRLSYNRALEIFNSISSKINFSTSTLEYKNELDAAIITLGKDFEETKSASIGYYYFLLLTEYYQNRNDFLSAKNSLLQLKELIEQNISVYTKNRIGNVFINLANNEFLMYNFQNCLWYANKALEYLYESSVNVGIIKEVEFMALFYSNNLIEAEKLIIELHDNSRITNTPFLFSKRAYLLSCIKTLKGQFAESSNLLNGVKEIERDKEGWNLGKRILLIINRIELKEFESADLKVLNLQKHIKRTLKIKYVRKREILILRILLKLINEKFDFKKVYKSRVRYFDLLRSNNDEYKWKIKSAELIIFHEWFLSKVENRPYNLSKIIEI